VSARKFTETSERYGSQWRTVARVTCRKCGVSESIGISATGGLIPPHQITKKFEQKGWTIGSNEQWDACPGCSNRENARPMLKVVDDKPAAPQPLREMGRDDRRVIFAKLDEVYLDEKRGYVSGWSDHKVATDLGVPRKWVEIIRAENFGTIGTNEDMQSFLTEAETLLADARKALAEARDTRTQIEALLQRPEFLTVSQISDRVGKIEKLASEVRKLVVLP
jgi:hypothetical protein